jgi:hypothetical protein
MEDSQRIIDLLFDNIINFIEKPSPAFNDMPVCPFAKQARLKNLIDIRVIDFSLESLDDRIVEIVESYFGDYKKLIIFAHPDKNICHIKLDKLGDEYEKRFPLLTVFRSHPLNEFSVDGLYTRREPYPNLQFVTNQHLEEARIKLSAHYYSKMSDDNLRDIGLK